MSFKIRGNTVGTPTPRTNYEQTDPKKADYLRGRDILKQEISAAKAAGDNANTAAGKAKAAADNAQTAANKAQTTANNAQTAANTAKNSSVQKTGDIMTGPLTVPEPTAQGHAANKGYVDGLRSTNVVTCLLADGWSGESAPYTQTIEIAGVTSEVSCTPHVGVVLTDDLETALKEIESFSYISKGETGEGTITFTCLEHKPEVNVDIQIEVHAAGGTGYSGSSGDGSSSGGNTGDVTIVGIASIKQTTTSTEDGGTNVITATLTNGTKSTFQVRNGSKGKNGAVGPQGPAGIGISHFDQTEGSSADNGTNTWRFILDDGRQFTFSVKNGGKGNTGETGPEGPQGSQGIRGTGIWKVITGPADYTTVTAGIKPIKRLILSAITGQANVTEVLAGDLVLHESTIYHIYHTDNSYAYMDTAYSIRGEKGKDGDPGPQGETGSQGPAGKDGKGFLYCNCSGLDAEDAMIPLADVQVPAGYQAQVGDLFLCADGNVFRITGIPEGMDGINASWTGISLKGADGAGSGGGSGTPGRVIDCMEAPGDGTLEVHYTDGTIDVFQLPKGDPGGYYEPKLGQISDTEVEYWFKGHGGLEDKLGGTLTLPRGASGRGPGILKVTTAPTSYTTTTGGIAPIKRMSISTIKTQAGVTEVLVGDQISYSYYLYHIYYLDATYAYMDVSQSIRGASGAKGSTGATGPQGPAGTDASVTKENIGTALGYTPADPSEHAVSVKALGAKGDGSTDDTAVFQTALAGHRRVYVPGGTYILSGALVIRDNCQLELAQDAVLRFTQTSGNCITMNRSAFLTGHHATVIVPYGFTGRVINVDTTVHTDTKDVPPWTHWDPQWKTARYLTDLNICKYDDDCIHQSKTGDSNGTAVYISADGGATSTFIWGLNFSGLRIAGAFEYGIRAVNFNKGWSHEMRLEAFIDACKIGLSIEDCNKVYFAGSIQPRKAANNAVYAKHGIQLIRSADTELSGSRVWDWYEKHTLWTTDKSNVNQHIAMYGSCKGTILNDYHYYHVPSGFNDLRELIYTDTPANYDSLIILQEPFTRWFKPIDGHPNFNNGIDGNQRLLLKSEQDALFQTDTIPGFTNLLPLATDESGAVFNGIGYKPGAYWNGTWNDSALYTENYNTYAATGYMRCTKGSVIRLDGIKFSAEENYEGIAVFDSAYNKLTHVSTKNLRAGSYFCDYTETDTGCTITLKNVDEFNNAFWFKMNLYPAGMSSNPVIAVDEEISYSQEGFLADGIHVKGEYVTGLDARFVQQNQRVLAVSSESTDDQYPTAKAVYSLVTTALGSYVNEVDALIGGGN